MEKQNYKNVDEYIANFPENVAVILEKIRDIIRTIAPDAVESISYEMPVFKKHFNNKKEIIAYIAGYKNHIGFYPMPITIAHFEQELQAYKYAKGSIQFSLKKDIPYELIRKMIIFRIEQIKKNN